MAVRIVIEADSPEELSNALEKLSWGNKQAPSAPASVQQSRPTWSQFLQWRSDNQTKVLRAFAHNRGKAMLRDLQEAAGLTRPQMAGVLASLQRAGKTAFGVELIQPLPGEKSPDGEWDRAYILNPDVYPGRDT